MKILHTLPSQCGANLEDGKPCSRPAGIVFRISRCSAYRCSIHEKRFRESLGRILRAGSWMEERQPAVSDYAAG